jgi:hypothetical protein
VEVGEITNWKWLLAFYLCLSLLTGAVSFNSQHYTSERGPQLQQQVWINFPNRGATADHSDIVYRANSTRILIPALIAAVVRLTGISWEYAFSLLRLVFIGLVYVSFHWYLRGWFPSPLAMVGTLFVAATVPLSFNNWFEIPTDFPEVLTYTLGLWSIREQRYGLFYLVVTVGTLNRETTAFLPLILLLCRLDRGCAWRVVPSVTVAGLAWLVPLAGARWWMRIGWRGAYGDSWAHNMKGLSHLFTNWNPYNNFLFYFYLFGAFWLLPFLSWRRQPLFLRRALLSLPAFLVIYLFFGGFMNEPREIVNLYPLLVPAGLFALFNQESTWRSTSHGLG